MNLFLLYLMIEINGLSPEEKNIVSNINKFRNNPSQLENDFKSISKFLGKMENKKDKSASLLELSKKLKTYPKVKSLKLSMGLCNAAHDILSKIIQKKEACTENIVKNYVASPGFVFQIYDEGGYNELIPRTAISDNDGERTHFKALKNNFYKYIGVASVCDVETNKNLILLANHIYEINQFDNRNFEETQQVTSKDCLNQDELNIVTEINKFRNQPQNYESNFRLASQIYSRFNRSKKQSLELIAEIEMLRKLPKLSSVKVSIGLCMLAEDLIQSVIIRKDISDSSSYETSLYDFRQALDILIEKKKSSFIKQGSLIYILDEGPPKNFIARCCVSEFDKGKDLYNAICSDEYTKIGISNHCKNGLQRNIIILGKDTLDFEANSENDVVYDDLINQNLISPLSQRKHSNHLKKPTFFSETSEIVEPITIVDELCPSNKRSNVAQDLEMTFKEECTLLLNPPDSTPLISSHTYENQFNQNGNGESSNNYIQFLYLAYSIFNLVFVAIIRIFFNQSFNLLLLLTAFVGLKGLLVLKVTELSSSYKNVRFIF